MNYRHAYHAGNFSDVLKHVVLALAIEHAKLKPAAFRVLDTHAGLGRYDLAATEAAKTGEWTAGIGRLLGPAAAAIPPQVAGHLAPYLNVVRAENPAGRLEHYPGSPLIARRLMRPQDRLIATELHPRDFGMLARRFMHDAQVKTIELDGWLALKAFLPPKERRGIVLIDPPYEQRDEWQQLAAGLIEAVRRFQGGTYLLWYPIKDPAAISRLHDQLRATGIPKILSAQLRIRAPDDPQRLSGCGLVIVNPPWTLAASLEVVLPFLSARLAVASGGGHALRWLA